MLAIRLSVLAAILAAGASVTLAEGDESIRLRGAIEKIDGNTLIVSPSKGVEVLVKLEPNFTVQKIAKASADEIKPGVKIGAQVKTEPDASLNAVQIIIFPEAPDSTSAAGAQAAKVSNANLMIADVAGREASDKGPVITVKYEDGQKRITIGRDVQIWRASSGSRADLRSGYTVSLTATKKDGEDMATNKITVSQSDVPPPL